MRDVVIADTSCLVLLEKINKMDLLRSCYNHVFITPEIAFEFGMSVPQWITVRSPTNIHLQEILMQTIGLGESSALALAYDIPNVILILDDLKARKAAKSLKLRITGTLGLIISAKNKGVLQSVLPILQQLQKTDFRISQIIIDKIKEISGE